MNDKPTVYIPHLLLRDDPLTKKRVPTINLLPASEFGDLSVLTADHDALLPDNFADSVALIGLGIAPIEEGDYIAMAGDPTLCAVAIHKALTILPRITILRWDHHKYTKLLIEA